MPHVHSGPIAKSLTQIEEALLPGFAFRMGDGRCLHPMGSGRILSLILGGYFCILAGRSKGVPVEEKIVHAFFIPDSYYLPESFGERSTGKSVRDWLERLSTLGSGKSYRERGREVDNRADRRRTQGGLRIGGGGAVMGQDRFARPRGRLGGGR